MMDENFYANLRKAAKAGLVNYADSAQWEIAMRWFVERNKGADEGYEIAYARLLQSDPEMKAMGQMCRQARSVGKTGRPRKYQPSPEQTQLSDVEHQLSKRSLARALREHTSFETAFVAEIDTPEGSALYHKMRS